MVDVMDFELEEARHRHHLEEIRVKFVCEMELEKTKHQDELETQRIKTAEIRKSMNRREDMEFMKSYGKS